MSSSTISPRFSEIPPETKRRVYKWLVVSAFAISPLLIWPGITRWLLTTSFLPHSYCYLQNRALVWTHVAADLLIGISYLSISATLGYLVYKARRNIPFHWMFLAFGLFIIACGGTHFVEVVTIWVPIYIFSAVVKLFTAGASLTAAVILPGIVSDVLELVQRAQASEHTNAKLRASEERKEALLREVHHRVKNNLAVICSLLYLQSTHTDDKESVQIFRDMENRVHSMALVHETLYDSENLARVNFAEYANALAKDILSSHRGPGTAICLKSDLEPVIMSMDLAVPCGLILNELVSNALKHAFPDGAAGEIRMTLHSGPQGICVLRVEDSGVGIPASLDVDRNKSLGLRLVKSLTKQIRGAFELVRIGPGTSAQLHFPVDPYAP